MVTSAPASTPGYPWYAIVTDDTIAQGDLLFKLPVYFPQYPEGIAFEPIEPEDIGEIEPPRIPSDMGIFDVIILSQSCDLVAEQDAPLSVIVCPIFTIGSGKPYYKSLRGRDGLNNIIKGREPGLHILNECKLPELSIPFHVVFFHQVLTVPVSYVRAAVEHEVRNSKPRLRLLPPYREHLAQAFGRFIMRIGLPEDIPRF